MAWKGAELLLLAVFFALPHEGCLATAVYTVTAGRTQAPAVANVALAGSTESWTSTNGAQTRGGSSAETGNSMAVPDFTNWLRATGFGFALPNPAVALTGVDVVIRGYNGDGADNNKCAFDVPSVRLVGPSLGPTDAEKSPSGITFPKLSGLTDYPLGGAADLWNLTSLLEAQVEDPSFGFQFYVRINLAGSDDPINPAVDFMDMSVTYEITTNVTGRSPASGPPAGGTLVTVSGHGFATEVAGNPVCRFGSSAPVPATVSTWNLLTCTSPAGTAGTQVALEVSMNSQNFTANGVLFSYDAAGTTAPSQSTSTSSSTSGTGTASTSTTSTVSTTTTTTSTSATSTTAAAPTSTTTGGKQTDSASEADTFDLLWVFIGVAVVCCLLVAVIVAVAVARKRQGRDQSQGNELSGSASDSPASKNDAEVEVYANVGDLHRGSSSSSSSSTEVDSGEVHYANLNQFGSKAASGPSSSEESTDGDYI